MISFTVIWAIVLRHLRVLKRDPNLMLSAFYWPFLDILTWGFLGSWISQSQSVEFHNYEAAALLGVLLWQVVGRGVNYMVSAFTEELWSNNIVNLFSLPIKVVEWMCGIIIFASIIMLCVSIVCILGISALYDLSIWYIISTFFLFLPPLFFCSIWLGFTCLQIIITFGKRSVELGFIIGWFLMPFSGAYYPVEILPYWGQKISIFLPMSYVFSAMRNYVMYQKNPAYNLIIGLLLSIVYAFCAVVLFVYFFNRSKNKGLARLVD